jgi:group I intron endonuclease
MNTIYRMGRKKDTKLAELKARLSAYGEVYVIRNTINDKRYVGQAVIISSKNRWYGTLQRWVGHKSDARQKSGGKCRFLNSAIRKYGEDKFEVEAVLTCKTEFLTQYEDMLMIEYDTLNHDKGYNLRTAGRNGRASEETKRRMSEAIRGEKHPQYGIPVKEETKRKIAQTIIDSVVRYDHDEETVLPKYLKYAKWKDCEGYHIVCHPLCKKKIFVRTKYTLQERKQIAVKYLNNLNEELAKQNTRST